MMDWDEIEAKAAYIDFMTMVALFLGSMIFGFEVGLVLGYLQATP